MPTKRVQLEVETDRVDDWDEYVENQPGVTTRADLIRKSVERFIADDNSVSDELNATLGEILEQNEAAIQRIDEVEHAVDTLRSENVEADEMETIVDTATGQIQRKLNDLADRIPGNLKLLVAGGGDVDEEDFDDDETHIPDDAFWDPDQ